MSSRFITTKKHNQCPNKLYKYIGNIEYVFDATENGTVYFPLSSTFNDPFDCKIGNNGLILDLDHSGDKSIVQHMIDEILFECDKFFIPFFQKGKDYPSMKNAFFQALGSRETITPSEYLQFVYKYSGYDGSYSDFYECIKHSYILSFPLVSVCRRVACFTESNNSIPMWAYYANSHKGVCLEYTPAVLKDDDVRKAIQKVTYIKGQFKPLHSIKCADDLNAMFFNKSISWKHEKEWRLVLMDNVERISFPCLTGIYLGTNFRETEHSKDDMSRIIRAMENIENEVTLYQAVPDSRQYKLNFSKII